MISSVIVEDNKEFAKILRKKIDSESEWGEEISVEIITNPLRFLEDLQNGGYCDLAFIDICMPEIDGLSLAKRVREINSSIMLVFVSSFLEYALDGYQVFAFDFLLKSCLDKKWDRFVERVRKVRKEARTDNNKSIYIVQVGKHIERIPIDEILYICKQEKNAVIHMVNRVFVIRKTMQDIKEELREYLQFALVKRGILINLDYLQKMTAREVVMQDGSQIAIGRQRIDLVRKQIHEYLREQI